MKQLLHTIFRSVHSIIYIEFLEKRNLNGPALIPVRVSEAPNQKSNFLASSLYKILGSFILILLFSNVSRAQTYLSPTGNLNITTNTTYSGAGIYTGTTTVKAGVTVIFTGGVSLSNSAKFVIEAGATVIINSGGFSTSSSTELTTATGSQLIIIAGGLNVNNSSKVTSNGALAVRGGGLSISSSATLGLYGVNQDTIIGTVSLNNSTVTTIDTGVELYIEGDVTSTSSAGMAVNGNVAINGNYQSWNSASVTGTGDMTTTGSMNAGGSSTIFGVNPYSCGGPGCNGRNACGRTATASTSTSAICTSGTSVTLTGVLSGTGTKTYQWLSSTTLGGSYTNISGATSSTYTFSATATRYYKVRMTVSGCTSTSNIISVTMYTSSVAPTGTSGVTSICAGTATTLTATGGTLASDAKAVWYEGSTCGGFTQNWTTQPYTTVRTTVNGVNGILNVTSAFDSWIEMYSLGSYNPNTYKYINIRYRVTSGNAGDVQMYFTNSTYTTANENQVVVRSLINDGSWQIMSIDMSSHASWTSSNITGWRYDFASGAATMDIDYISLTSTPAGDNSSNLSSTFSPTVTTNYLVRYEGICNTTACRSVTVTVNPPTIPVAGTDVSTCAGSGAVSIVTGSSAPNNNGVGWSSNGTGSFTGSNSLINAKYTPSAADIAAGSRTLTLTSIGKGACPDVTSTKTLTIISPPSAVGAITGISSVCKGQTLTYSISAVANATSYNWAVPTGATITAGVGTTSISVSYAGASVPSGSVSVDAVNTCATTSKSLAVTINTSCANNWIGVTSTDWNVASNWSLGIIPESTHDVVIPASTPFAPTIFTTGTVASFTNNNTLTVASAAILNVYGNITNNSNVTPVSGSTVAFKGGSAQTVSGVPVLYNVQVANTSGGVALSSAVTVKGTVTLTSGVLTTNSNLTINFDNGGNIAYNSTDAGSISGNVSGRRDAVARTHYISVPFNGVTSAQVQATTPLFYNNYWKMYTKTFATQGWAAVTDATTAMPLGTGFSLALPSAAPLIFTGTYNHSYTLPGASYSNAAAAKYILIGNPYPSALDWTNGAGWTKTNVANAIYYWDAAGSKVSSYVAGVSTNGGTQYIPAMQAFMVTTTGTGGATSSVAINNTARLSSQNPSFLRAGSDETIRIKLTGSNADQWDDAVVRFNEMATTSFDTDWDAYKILSRGPSPLIYTTLGEDMYSINSVPVASALPIVDVVVYIPADGNYTLSVINSDPTTDYVLVDKKLGTDNLLSGSDYVFSGSATDAVNRFQLQLRSSANTITTGTASVQNGKSLQIYSTIKGFVIQTEQFGGSEAGIEILDMAGKSVKSLENNLSTGSTYVMLDLSDGAYLVKVTVDGNTFAGMISLTK